MASSSRANVAGDRIDREPLASPAQFDPRTSAGLLVTSSTDPAELKACLDSTDLCVVEADHFADGRGFSLVRLIADSPRFKGRIQVRGDVIFDQVAAYIRCGADQVLVGTRIYNAGDFEHGGSLRYQRAPGDRPGVDTLIPDRRQGGKTR